MLVNTRVQSRSYLVDVFQVEQVFVMAKSGFDTCLAHFKLCTTCSLWVPLCPSSFRGLLHFSAIGYF